MKEQQRKWLYGTISFIWFFAVIISYYLMHKPFSAGIILHLGLAVWRIAAAFGLVALGGGIGTHWLQDESIHPLARFALQAGLGLGILSMGVLLSGLTVGFIPWLLWALYAGLLFLFRKSILKWLSQLKSLRGIWQNSGAFEHILAAILVVLFLLVLTVALAPPVKYDSLLYHLAVPEDYLRAGRIVDLPWNVLSGMSQSVGLLYVWLIPLGGIETAPVLSWWLGMLVFAGTLGYLLGSFESRAAWVGAAALFSGYSLIAPIGWGYVDIPAMLMGLGMLVCLDVWRREGSVQGLRIAGVFAGMAIGMKYTAGTIALGGLAVVSLCAWKKKERILPLAFNFGIPVVLLALPWLLKNFILTGNPVYPFMFASGAMTQIRIDAYQDVPAWGNWMDLLLLPLRATYIGIEGKQGYSTSIGPLLLGFAALAWMGPKESGEKRKICLQNAAVVSIVGVIIWVLANQYSGALLQSRYYYVVFPAFAVLAAGGFSALDQLNFPQIRLGRVFSAFTVLVMLFLMIELGSETIQRDAPQAALGLIPQSDYLAANLGWFGPAMEAVENLPQDSHVLMLFETRSLYCRTKCLPDETFDRWLVDWRTYRDEDVILDKWREEGITHILVYDSEIEAIKQYVDTPYAQEDFDALQRLLGKLGAPMDLGGAYSLYTIP